MATSTLAMITGVQSRQPAFDRGIDDAVSQGLGQNQLISRADRSFCQDSVG
jgi:hypothetical protein